IDSSLVLECDCVTGCVRDGNATPDGLYSLYYKKSPAILIGEDYETKVTYWMPFNGGIGLHDATWRGRFGGDIYMNGGSHGCVNLPFSSAAAIYSMIYPGMPVICYY
ncbi:MAG: L,D-transpeptidase, partial [Coprococcus sp.]